MKNQINKFSTLDKNEMNGLRAGRELNDPGVTLQLELPASGCNTDGCDGGSISINGVAGEFINIKITTPSGNAIAMSIISSVIG